MQNRIRVLIIDTQADSVDEKCAVLTLIDNGCMIRLVDGTHAAKPFREAWSDQPVYGQDGCVLEGVRIVA